MTLASIPTRTLLLLALAASAAHAQDTAPPAPTAVPAKKPHPKIPQAPYNPNVILLDPAHGGTDNGAKLTDNVQEKDATLAFANRLKDLLAARGFTVLLTHEAATDQLASDQRAELANRSHAVACILLHAANGGHGIHLYTSSISPLTTLISSVTASSDEPKAIQPWGTAQAAMLPQSLSLAGELSSAFYAIRVPLVIGKASIAPIDSLTCPAVAVELASLNSSTPASDAAYEQRIAEAMATGLNAWRGHILAQLAAAAAATATPATIPAAPKPAAPRKPVVPKSIPVETPDSLTPAPAPAPIEHRPPTSPPQ